jgi:hypothetical protein
MCCTKISLVSFEDIKVTVRLNFWGLKIGSTIRSGEIYNCFAAFLNLKGKTKPEKQKTSLAYTAQLK